MKLRFDAERSPMDEIPTELREPLYRIYLEHAKGAVQRSGRTWVDMDLLNNPALKHPFPFDTPANTVSKRAIPQGGGEKDKENYLLGELTWPEAKVRFREVDIALLPVGAIEQHGPHLPLDCDSFDAEYLAVKVAREVTENSRGGAKGRSSMTRTSSLMKTGSLRSSSSSSSSPSTRGSGMV